MRSKSLISVIVVNYNGQKHLPECLGSLQSQSYSNLEVILVDNGSNDNSIPYVRKNFPDIKIIPLDKNLGFAGGSNMGIKVAKGEYVALLNNDAVPQKGWISELYSEIVNDRKVGICASKIMSYFDRKMIDSTGDYYTVGGDPGKIGEGQLDSQTYNEKRYIFGACAAAALYRRSLFEEIGLFDEDFFCYFEDIDLSFRAQLAGYKCLYIPTAIVYHKVSATQKPGSPFLTYYVHRNIDLVYYKNMPTYLIFKYLHAYITIRILAAIYWIMRGRGFIYLQSKLSFLSLLRKVLKKRRKIQKSRKVPISYIDTILEKQWLKVQLRKRSHWMSTYLSRSL